MSLINAPRNKSPSTKTSLPDRPGFYLCEFRESRNGKDLARYYISDWECHRVSSMLRPFHISSQCITVNYPNTVQQGQPNQRPKQSLDRKRQIPKSRYCWKTQPRWCKMGRGKMLAGGLLPWALRRLLGCRCARIPATVLRGLGLWEEVCESRVWSEGVAAV
jgi:hypothetical protein